MSADMGITNRSGNAQERRRMCSKSTTSAKVQRVAHALRSTHLLRRAVRSVIRRGDPWRRRAAACTPEGHDHRMPPRGRRSDHEDDDPTGGLSRTGARTLEVAENVVYGGIATFLVGTALVCLVLAGKTAWGLIADFSEQPVLDLLDILLLVFIVVELLFAVRTTVEKRELLAEPFLLVGIIASIKEIVVLSVESAKEVGNGAEFTDRIIEIGVLGVLVLLLGLTSFLLRRKEREPDEAASDRVPPEREVD
jgi:uncharacterized membrane protein (DUF373 family)